MVNMAFTAEEMTDLRTLLDIPPNKQPTAELILQCLRRGSAAGMELCLSQRADNPVLLDARRRQLEAATKKGGR